MAHTVAKGSVIGVPDLTEFDPEELQKIIRNNRVKPTKAVIDRLDHLSGHLSSIATHMGSLNEKAERSASWTQGAANQLAAIRGMVVVIMICAVAIAWKVVFGS